jgi:hypothetical protein
MGELRKLPVILTLLFPLVFGGCDIPFNLSLDEFTAYQTSTALGSSWEVRSFSSLGPASGVTIIPPATGQAPESVIAVALINPQAYPLNLELVNSAQAWGGAAFRVEQESALVALIRITGARMGDEFRFTLRLRTTDGLRSFPDYSLPLIRCNTLLELSGAELQEAAGRRLTANWIMPSVKEHLGLNSVTLEFQEENGSIIRETYGWDEANVAGPLTGGPDISGRNFSFDPETGAARIDFPMNQGVGRSPPVLYYFFRVRAGDLDGFTAETLTPGFDTETPEISGNAYLGDLSVNGVLEPDFLWTTLDYSARLDPAAQAAEISGTATAGSSVTYRRDGGAAISLGLATEAPFAFELPALSFGVTALEIQVISPNGADSKTYTIALQRPPAVPNVTLTVGAGQIKASWPPVAGASAYEVYYSATNNLAAALKWEETAVTESTITGLPVPSDWYMWVRALAGTVIGDFSPSAFGRILIGQISITISGAGDENISGMPAGGITISRVGDGEINAAIGGGYSSVAWYVDAIARGSSASITVRARDFAAGYLTLTVLVFKDGVPYTNRIAFAVAT